MSDWVDNGTGEPVMVSITGEMDLEPFLSLSIDGGDRGDLIIENHNEVLHFFDEVEKAKADYDRIRKQFHKPSPSEAKRPKGSQ